MALHATHSSFVTQHHGVAFQLTVVCPLLFVQGHEASTKVQGAEGNGSLIAMVRFPSLAIRASIDAPRGNNMMSARSRRLATLPAIPEYAQPAMIMEAVLPHLEDLEKKAFSSLTQQLMKLCDELNTSEDSAGCKSSGGLDDGGNSSRHTQAKGWGASSSEQSSRGWKDSAHEPGFEMLPTGGISASLEPSASSPMHSWRDPIPDTRVVQSDANSTAALSSTQGHGMPKLSFARPPGTAAGQLRYDSMRAYS